MCRGTPVYLVQQGSYGNYNGGYGGYGYGNSFW